jgi:hypothetical protein
VFLESGGLDCCCSVVSVPRSYSVSPSSRGCTRVLLRSRLGSLMSMPSFPRASSYLLGNESTRQRREQSGADGASAELVICSSWIKIVLKLGQGQREEYEGKQHLFCVGVVVVGRISRSSMWVTASICHHLHGGELVAGRRLVPRRSSCGTDGSSSVERLSRSRSAGASSPSTRYRKQSRSQVLADARIEAASGRARGGR